MRFLSFFLVFLLLLSCHKETSRSDLDEKIERANRWIDEGQYDRAIQSLETEKEKQTHPRLQATLASAYAARAGLKIQRFLKLVKSEDSPFFSSLKTLDSERKKWALRVLEVWPTTEERGQFLGRLGLALDEFQIFLQRFEDVPTVTSQQREDLYRAQKVLEKSESEGLRLYRALIGVVVVKSLALEAESIFQKVEPQLRQLDFSQWNLEKNRQILCLIDVSSFQNWLQFVVEQLLQVKTDLVVAFPAKKEQIEKQTAPLFVARAYLRLPVQRSCP